ncbi:thiamine diphosphokinase [Anaerobacillus sp. CMMVII]|uniref:thiamine diphosphokinase n=1 Tax=Anaerobacillus sp. CMMVII TaxID=2755588 RepID=UPI0021B6EEF0|nr:thiamine diphosphokinase [Anaerobacillus sp. CMMVII]MCT8139783.1 thiamine diphosphokinase [Anaerobacillus sp. CMMVII]
MKNINIVAGGPFSSLPVLRLDSNEIWIAVDRGLEHLLRYDIEPDYVLGDFDSVSPKLMNKIRQQRFKQFPAQKDETDLELAISYALKEKPDIINVFGATGGRLDHGLVNLQLLLRSIDRSTTVFMIDNKNKITLKKPGMYSINKSEYKYVSFLSFFEKIEGLTLQGFKYPLTLATLECGSSLCISNELILDIGTYSFSSGILIVVESCD